MASRPARWGSIAAEGGGPTARPSMRWHNPAMRGRIVAGLVLVAAVAVVAGASLGLTGGRPDQTAPTQGSRAPAASTAAATQAAASATPAETAGAPPTPASP